MQLRSTSWVSLRSTRTVPPQGGSSPATASLLRRAAAASPAGLRRHKLSSALAALAYFLRNFLPGRPACGGVAACALRRKNVADVRG
jgi:hypothetical protein